MNYALYNNMLVQFEEGHHKLAYIGNPENFFEIYKSEVKSLQIPNETVRLSSGVDKIKFLIPAHEQVIVYIAYVRDGVCHREDGPATIQSTLPSESYFYPSYFYQEDLSGGTDIKCYFLNGKLYDDLQKYFEDLPEEAQTHMAFRMNELTK